MQKVNFKLESFDDSSRKKLIEALSQNQEILSLLNEKNIPLEEITLHPYRLNRYLETKSLCKNCLGLTYCKQKQKGFYESLAYHGILEDELVRCDYAQKKDQSEAHLKNYLVSDLGSDYNTVSFSNMKLEQESKTYISVLSSVMKAYQNHEGIYLYGNMGTGKTYLAACALNEEVTDGKSEHGNPVIRRNMRQWVLKITAYAESLLDELDEVDWPESTKEMQKNWIGKSTGAEVVFKIDNTNKEFTVYTTRCDTLFGATYCVMSPEHPYVNEITTPEQKEAVESYQKACATKSDLERTDLNKDKTGVFTGAYAVNPVNGKKIPIWISDYVLASYGTGAIMAVPAHDTRDYEFAKKFGLEIIPVLEGGDIEKEAWTEDGVHINSEWLNGLGKQEAINKMISWLEEHHCGNAKVQYKLRDWLFSRQRYWGEPIPIVHMSDGTMRTVSLDDLPLELPEVTNYQPSEDGESPLAHATDWLHVEIDGVEGTRETNTMPQWAGSCWYYLRYLDPHNDSALADPELIKHWMPVDLYIGGAEHAVLHLLYSRFWYKVLRDCGVVFNDEPFKKLFHQGMILGENGIKMSKSLGNVVNPDELVESHGADALRLYEMFMGPLESSKPWSTQGMNGARKWLERVYRLATSDMVVEEATPELDFTYNATVKKVTEDNESLNFNTGISQMMIFINDVYKLGKINKGRMVNFLRLLYPIAPHICEELNEILTGEEDMSYDAWPTYDESKLVVDQVTVIVQVNGKMRAKLDVTKDADQDEVKELALKQDNVKPFIEGKEIKKVIVIPNKIVNIVVA